MPISFHLCCRFCASLYRGVSIVRSNKALVVYLDRRLSSAVRAPLKYANARLTTLPIRRRCARTFGGSGGLIVRKCFFSNGDARWRYNASVPTETPGLKKARGFFVPLPPTATVHTFCPRPKFTDFVRRVS
jgi:hypothetical protein